MSLVAMIVGGYLAVMVATLVVACALGRAGARSDEGQDRDLRELERTAAGAPVADRWAVAGEREHA